MTETLHPSGRRWELCGPSYPGSKATSDRGWFFAADGTPLGHFLDYGQDHYRSPHEYCNGVCRCRKGNPGNIHAVLVTNEGAPMTGNGQHYRYCRTIHEAKTWIERRRRYQAKETR